MTALPPVAPVPPAASVPRPRRGRRGGEPTAPRLPVIVVVLVVLIGAGALAGLVGTSGPGQAPAVTAASMVAPGGAQSASWYCTGGTGPGGAGPSTVYLDNTTGHPVSGTELAVNGSGATATVPLTVPAYGQLAVVPGQSLGDGWVAGTYSLDSGGVAVLQAVRGPTGWSQTPCASASSATWYFATGSTQAGKDLYLSIYNPTATSAVVDLSFATPSGPAAPEPFQGLVVAPGQLVVANVTSYVQDKDPVSTEVKALSGRVVADELQTSAVPGNKELALQLGAPAPSRQWAFPRSVDASGGTTELQVFNPASVPQRVVVRVRIASGALAPFTQTVPALSGWTLETTTASRIPLGADYATTVSASGGPGVVVGRTVASPAGSLAVPQLGSVLGVVPSAGVRTWLVATPAVDGNPGAAGVALSSVAIQSLSGTPLAITVEQKTSSGVRPIGGLAPFRLPADGFVVLGQSVIAPAVPNSLVITATGPIAVTSDALPAGAAGVVSLPALGPVAVP